MEKTFDYKIDNKTYKVLVEYKNNKNTYIKVKDDLTIHVTTNIFTTKRDVKHLLSKNEDFLKKVLNKVNQRIKRDNDFYYLGIKYDIILVPFEQIEIDKDKIYVSSGTKLEKWLKNETKRVFSERLEICFNLFEEKIPFPNLKIRTMKTRWGVCNKRDTSITLNAKLIKYDISDIDYVIIHELSHFICFDHSKDFWNIVAKYMPDYKKSVKILKG